MLFVQSCQKSSTGDFIPAPIQSDTSWVSTDSIPSVTTAIEKPVIVDSFNSNADESGITSGDSLAVNFPAGGCMTAPNNPYTTIKNADKVRAAVVLLTSKGDIIRHRLSTESNGNPLIFGTYVNIRLFYKGQQVFWNGALPPVQVKVRDYNILKGLKYYFYQPLPASTTNGRDSAWLPATNPITGNVAIYTETVNRNPKTSYLIRTNRLGWFGCDSLVNYANANHTTTRLNVILPINYTNKNTIVYAVFDKIKSVVRLRSNTVGKTYSTTNIPVGASITLISLSKINNVYYIGTKSVVVSSSTPFTLKPVQKDITEIDQYLKTL